MTAQLNDLSPIDEEIYGYLSFDHPQSFLLFAGAGSGKTRTLVNVLKKLKHNHSEKLSRSGKKVAIITYTNAACEEVKDRLDYDINFEATTIHSFCWELIKPFTMDICVWLQEKLNADIEDLNVAIGKAKNPQGVTVLRNVRSLSNKKKRLDSLAFIKSFSYSPTSNSSGKGTLNHSEVISLAAYFLETEPLMRTVLRNKYPFVLIDESQDTNKDLLEALISTQQETPNKLGLGLFGDMMQRVYNGGKTDLSESLPVDWKSPEKTTNYRCPSRIVSLINKIRSSDDNHRQNPAQGAKEGHVRLFIVDTKTKPNKYQTERTICEEMMRYTNDPEWTVENGVKTLTLEHHMAAVRDGFDEFFIPFLSNDRLRDAALNGQSTEIKFIVTQFVPLVRAVLAQDDFKTASILRKYSGLLSPTKLSEVDDPISHIKDLDSYVSELVLMLQKIPQKSMLEVLRSMHDKSILSIPDAFIPLLEENDIYVMEDDKENSNAETEVWASSLSAPYGQVIRYSNYVSDKSSYDTHQGVKGLQYDRVMVILDDEEARGFLFSYEKLLGAVPLSAIDTTNDKLGKDNTPKRSRRLFYVTCSRAQQGLAVVAYTKSPALVEDYAIESEWFLKSEISNI